MKEKDPEYLSTLERGLSVLRAFDEDHAEMRLTDIARRTALSPAVVRRCLNTLVALGYVGQHGRLFLLRPEVLSIGSAFLSSMNIGQVCTPALQHLRDETGDSASMAVISGNDILYLAHVSTDRRIRLDATVGTRFPLHATSLGKAILAFRPELEIDDFLAGTPFPRFTERTLTDAVSLQERLLQVRARGYDSALDELDYGIVSVAIPIFDGHHRAIAAVNCSTSTSRVSQDELVATRIPPLREAAREIEAELRRHPALVHALEAS
jgi:IclR family transcriptional regulator, pca regulon regulatory protein